MVPTTDNALVFIGGATTSGPSQQMQNDMNTLTSLAKLPLADYQMQWHATQ
jgi:hypothetical protein